MMRHVAPNGTPMSPSLFQQAATEFTSTRAAVTVSDADGVQLIDADSLAVASHEPPLIMVAVENRRLAPGQFQAADRFSVILLPLTPSAGAGASSLTDDQAATEQRRGGVLLLDAPVRPDRLKTALSCRVTETHVTGDHTLIIGRVDGVSRPDCPAPAHPAPRSVEFTGRSRVPDDWPAEMDYAC